MRGIKVHKGSFDNSTADNETGVGKWTWRDNNSDYIKYMDPHNDHWHITVPHNKSKE
jgi:hypothetical protein